LALEKEFCSMRTILRRLATTGVYSVCCYTVVRLTAEIGVRMALSARRAGVVATVMRGAMIQAALIRMLPEPWYPSLRSYATCLVHGTFFVQLAVACPRFTKESFKSLV
jgi:hypothetical protein